MAFSLLCFIFLFCNFHTFVVSLNEDGSALLSFKGSLTDYAEGCFANWDASLESPCSWLGVQCKGQKVVALTVPNKRLLGTLTLDLGKLSSLQHLNLQDNKLFGGLPPELFNAVDLNSLILSRNSFSGSVPPEIGKLGSLITLDLSHNSFIGSIPSSLVQCKSLKIVFLNGNNFSGQLPIGFGTSLTALQRLDLSSNTLDSSIPNDMGNLTNLAATLDLSRNSFSGLIPSSLGNLPVTVYINLSFNNLSGPIPQTDNLLSLGPPAFLGNPLLCGLPLKNPCSAENSQSMVAVPTTKPERKHYHVGVVITITICILVGTFLIGLLVSYSCKNNGINQIGGCKFEDTLIIKKEMFCFAKNVLETLSESMEQYSFVRLDQKIDFNIDQLLTASAFLLGKSENGIVYKVVLENGPTLVVRRLGEGGDSHRFREFQIEVEAIGKIKHPNVLALKAYCWSAEEKLLIYDYVPNGDLASAIHGKPGLFFTALSWPARLKIMKGIARGLTYLHECSPKKYIHGNLKPSNILLGHNMEAQISDLGLRRLSGKSGESSSSFHSEHTTFETPPKSHSHNSEFFSTTSSPSAALGARYKAPEVSNLRKPSQKWDVYSFGVIMVEMISGKLPLVQAGSGEMDIVRRLDLGIEETKPLLDILDPFLAHDLDMQNEIVAALKIAVLCVHKSPEKRPTMRHVCDVLARLA